MYKRQLDDCSGCPYTMCIHFGEKGECFYGGVMSREVYPAVRRADGVVMLCPNYNDALSANLTAFINRLTALFRQTRFYDKALFALVVSGYSGSDLVARQLISAMNMNKSFYLPGRFALLETANDPGEAMGLPGVRDRLDRFADHMLEVLAQMCIRDRPQDHPQMAQIAAAARSAAGGSLPLLFLRYKVLQRAGEDVSDYQAALYEQDVTSEIFLRCV